MIWESLVRLQEDHFYLVFTISHSTAAQSHTTPTAYRSSNGAKEKAVTFWTFYDTNVQQKKANKIKFIDIFFLLTSCTDLCRALDVSTCCNLELDETTT